MSTRRLLIAALVLAGLGGAIWWSNKQEAAKAAKEDPDAPPKVLSFQEDQLKRVEIQRGSDPPTVLEQGADPNDPQRWAITSPSGFDADIQAIAAITSGASNLSSQRMVAENVTDLAPYGLQPPEISVTLTMQDGSTKRLRLGGPTPDDSGAYASVDGDPRLFTIATFDRSTYDKGLPELRDKHLLKFLPNDIERIALDVPGKPGLEFGKNSDERWEILKPRKLRADQTAANKLLGDLKDAAMDPESQDAAGKDAAAERAFPSARVVATVRVTAAGKTETLEVRHSGDDYFARSSSVPGVYKVYPVFGEAVNKTLADFQDKQLFDFGFNEPTKVELKTKDDTTTFEKMDMDWLSNGRVMDSVGVQNVIDKLRDLAAARVDDVAAGAPDMELTVVSKGGSRTEKVRLAPAGSDYIAVREGEPTLYRIDGATISVLIQAFGDVREAPLPDQASKGAK